MPTDTQAMIEWLNALAADHFVESFRTMARKCIAALEEQDSREKAAFEVVQHEKSLTREAMARYDAACADRDLLASELAEVQHRVELTEADRDRHGRDYNDAVEDINRLTAELAETKESRDKLQAFKDWTHAYLDSHGVPHHPPGTHGAEGCRIGDRMDWLMAQLAETKAELDRTNGQSNTMVDIIERMGRDLEGERKARELLLKGMESQSEIGDGLKHENRRLTSELAEMQEIAESFGVKFEQAREVRVSDNRRLTAELAATKAELKQLRTPPTDDEIAAALAEVEETDGWTGNSAAEVLANIVRRLVVQVAALRAVCEFVIAPDHPIGSDAEHIRKLRAKVHALAAGKGAGEK